MAPLILLLWEYVKRPIKQGTADIIDLLSHTCNNIRPDQCDVLWANDRIWKQVHEIWKQDFSAKHYFMSFRSKLFVSPNFKLWLVFICSNIWFRQNICASLLLVYYPGTCRNLMRSTLVASHLQQYQIKP